MAKFLSDLLRRPPSKLRTAAEPSHTVMLSLALEYRQRAIVTVHRFPNPLPASARAGKYYAPDRKEPAMTEVQLSVVPKACLLEHWSPREVLGGGDPRQVIGFLDCVTWEESMQFSENPGPCLRD